MNYLELYEVEHLVNDVWRPTEEFANEGDARAYADALFGSVGGAVRVRRVTRVTVFQRSGPMK